MCGSIVDIQSAAAEIRRGIEKEERGKKETTGQKYNGLSYSIGRRKRRRRNHRATM